jgi:hypothetical protein
MLASKQVYYYCFSEYNKHTTIKNGDMVVFLFGEMVWHSGILRGVCGVWETINGWSSGIVWWWLQKISNDGINFDIMQQEVEVDVLDKDNCDNQLNEMRQ